MGNEQRNCDGYNCPQNWVDTSAIFCYAQGDCGNYRNVANQVTTAGFETFAGDDVYEERSYTYLADDAIDHSYRLTLPINVEYPSPYTGAFDHPLASAEKMAEGKSQWLAEASGWDDCDMCKCILGIPIPGCEFKKHIHGSNYCSIWQAPQTTNACETCGDTLHPCTEYWCRSLGQNCNPQQDEDGMIACAAGRDNLPPLKIQNITVNENYSLGSDILFYGGASYTGYEITPDIPPYDLVYLTLELNQPAQCSLKSLPVGFLGEELYYKSATPKRIHNISLHARPTMGYAQEAVRNLGFANIIEGLTLDRIDQRIERFYEGHPQYEPQARGAVELWQSQLDPTARNIIESWENQIQSRAIEATTSTGLLKLTCINEAGQQLPETTLHYTLLEDEFAPTLLYYNGSYGGPTEFSITLNEPAECRYAQTDTGWENMQNTMACPFAVYGLQAAETTCYGDSATLGDNYHGPVHIRCRDQPGYWRNFSIRLNLSANFTLRAAFLPRYIKLMPPNTILLNKTTSGLSQLPPFEVNTPTTKLQFRFKSFRTCAIDGIIPGLTNYPRFHCGSLNGTYGCDVEVPSSVLLDGNVTTYPIRCRDVLDVNEEHFEIII
jgi:hypothetical protein